MDSFFPSDLQNSITFHIEQLDFELTQASRIQDWISTVIKQRDCRLIQLNYIFCSDEYLHEINLEYLQHDTYTDIITFPYQNPPIVEGDIFISIDRVRENAQQFGVTFEQELLRVIIHGVLHLCGQGDKSAEEQQQMRKLEDWALAFFANQV